MDKPPAKPAPEAGFNLEWHLRHISGYLLLEMREEARKTLEAIPVPLQDRQEVRTLRLELAQRECDWATASTLAAILVDESPESVAWWVAWAYAVRRCHGITEARLILLHAERLHPREAIIHFNLGCYACQMEQDEEAIRRVEMAMTLDSSYRQIASQDEDLLPLRKKGWTP